MEKVSYSPVLRVRRFIDRMKSERNSPRLKRFPSRTISEEARESFSPMHLRKSSRKDFLSRYTGDNNFNKLPDEATMFIFSFLEVEDLLSTRGVSREFRALADDDLVWKDLCHYDWNIKTKLCPTWKQTYIRLDDLFSDGVWEGMSKWVEPVGYANEQKTTARLHFMRRSRTSQTAQSSTLFKSSPTVIHRVDSQANTGSPAPQRAALPIKNFRDSTYKINGGGITVNCQAPSPFKIEGERSESDDTGCTFVWNKQFEKHISIYNGKLDFNNGTVEGTIDYHDGNTHWKGVFLYNKATKKLHKNKTVNA